MTVRNWERKSKECSNSVELLAHLLDVEKPVSVLTKILAAVDSNGNGFTPDEFITKDTERAVSQFIRFKRYGLHAMYSDSDAPESMLQAFDILQGELDRIEREQIENARTNGNR